jgi:hypothetical protein
MILYCFRKRFRPVAKRSIQTTSIEANIWAHPTRIASLASNVVTKAASRVTSQLKKINLSPSRTPRNSGGGKINPAMEAMEDGRLNSITF